jgi:hypothetical protein
VIQSITKTHRNNAYASRVIDSTDAASSSENATALTGCGFNTGVLRLWHAIATRSVAIAGEKFHEIQRSGFTMHSPAQGWVPLGGFRSSGGDTISVSYKRVLLSPVPGELGVVCEQVTTAIKTRGSTSAKSHGITNWIVRFFLVSERAPRRKVFNECC